MWTLLKNQADWDRHRSDLAVTLNTQMGSVIWGTGPTRYPCLVSSLVPPQIAEGPIGQHTLRVISAYVYPTEAELLLSADGRHYRNQDAAVPPTQAQWNRWMTAQMLTLIEREIGVGLWGPGGEKAGQAAFEEALGKNLELVDQYRGEKRAELRKSLAGYATTVLDGLEPPK